MFAGHYAAGLVFKAAAPRAPTWALLLGVGFLDALFGTFVLIGIEHVTITPGSSPGFRLDFIDWSHSFAMSLAWAALYGWFFLRRGLAVSACCAAAVFSHFVLDFAMHPGDLALWPHASTHLGLGPWALWPHGWWFFELAFVGCCCAYYLVQARASSNAFGGRAWAVVAIVLVLHVLNAPWIAPVH